MLISLAELKPSPFNPKKPLTKKQLAAVENCVNTFDWKRSLAVCRDFISGEGFFTLDGNDAIKILRKIGKTEVDCHIVEKVVDMKTLKQFMAGYSINKTPIYSEFATELGEIDFSEFTGLDFSKFSFDVKIDDIAVQPIDFSGDSEPDKPQKTAHGGGQTVERQTQYFLTLPPDCVDKLRNFVKTKAFNSSKTEAITQKIDAMNDTQFLENILQIIL